MKFIISYKLFESDDLDPQVEPESDLELNPVRFFEIDLADMYDFIEGLLYNKRLDVSFTEKIAGQHMTIEIKDGKVWVQTKGKEKVDPKDTPFSRRITKGMEEYVANNPVDDVTWRFEVVNPKHNHDFIKYRNTETVAVEYTGRMTKEQAEEITVYTDQSIIFSSEQIIPALKDEARDELKDWWEGGFKRKLRKLRPTKSGYYKFVVNTLRLKLLDVISQGFVSAIDNMSPIEGMVAKVRKKSFKIQGKDYLAIQKVQMPFFSLVKLTKDEIAHVLANPNEPFTDLQVDDNGMEFKSIYDRNEHLSFKETIDSYLEQNTKLDIDDDKYNRWFDQGDSQEMIDELEADPDKLGDIYFKIRKIALKPGQKRTQDKS